MLCVTEDDDVKISIGYIEQQNVVDTVAPGECHSQRYLSGRWTIALSTIGCAPMSNGVNNSICLAQNTERREQLIKRFDIRTFSPPCQQNLSHQWKREAIDIKDRSSKLDTINETRYQIY